MPLPRLNRAERPWKRFCSCSGLIRGTMSHVNASSLRGLAGTANVLAGQQTWRQGEFIATARWQDGVYGVQSRCLPQAGASNGATMFAWPPPVFLRSALIHRGRQVRAHAHGRLASWGIGAASRPVSRAASRCHGTREGVAIRCRFRRTIRPAVPGGVS